MLNESAGEGNAQSVGDDRHGVALPLLGSGQGRRIHLGTGNLKLRKDVENVNRDRNIGKT